LLAPTIDSLRTHIARWTGSRNVTPGYVQPARALYRMLLEPVEGALQGKTHLIVVPDSNLTYIPFEALLTTEVEQEGEGLRHSKLPYLVKAYTVSYTYSATLLHDLLEQAKRRPSPRRDFIAFAPVEFADADSVAQADARQQEALEAFRTRDLFDEGPLKALPHTEAEVQGILHLFDDGYGLFDRIGAVFTGKRADVLIREQANESLLKQLPLDQYRFVHFATHAGANADNGLLSAIVLPVENTARADSSDSDDGLLYLSEVYAMSLNAEMVVLSACETGLGEILTGEGVIGLTRGFCTRVRRVCWCLSGRSKTRTRRR